MVLFHINNETYVGWILVLELLRLRESCAMDIKTMSILLALLRKKSIIDRG